MYPMADQNFRPESIRKVELIIDGIADGVPLAKLADLHGVSLWVFHHVISSVRELSVRYDRMRQMRADVMADEMLEIADTPMDTQWQRNRLDTRKWLASKYNPKVFGDRIDLNVQQSISITDAQAEARARLLPVVVDAVIVDRVRDAISTSEDKLPDIFT